MSMSLLVYCGIFASVAAVDVPVPTHSQLKLMDMGMAMFMHYSVNSFDSKTQHNCVNGTDGPPCLPASIFDPSNLSTDQWVEAAVAMGAGEICLTAHHEGGFALWDTKFSNYSVMHSPYGRDIVEQFVASCKRYGVRPCYYFPPNANGWFVQNGYSADAFVEAQLGMLTELLTKYGTDYVSRLWWDHYGGPESGPGNHGEPGSGGCWEPGTPKRGPNPVMCPYGALPAAWPRFIELVRRMSPSTVICPGPDCDTRYRHTGLHGVYPDWYACKERLAHGTNISLGCTEHVSALEQHDDSALIFHPYTYNDNMHTGWFCNGECDDITKFWNATRIWQTYMATVGIGKVATFNAPPGTSGQISPPLVDAMSQFGKALRALLKPVSQSAHVFDQSSSNCNDTVVAEIDLAVPTQFNMIKINEDLALGQRISQYAIDYYPASDTGAKTGWRTFETGNFSDLSLGMGIHGLSVGAQVFDFIPPTLATKVRFRCLRALGASVYLKSFSLHHGPGPLGPIPTESSVDEMAV